MNKTTPVSAAHIEALKLAEEAIEQRYECHTLMQKEVKALAAIREALAERQDKPAECANGCPENTVCDYCQRAEPVKQEPVAILKSSKANFERQFGKQVFADWIYDDLTYSFENAAPVDAKAIRAEALEEAAKVCDDKHDYMCSRAAAAIRGLK